MDELRHALSLDEMCMWAALLEIDGPFLPQRLDILTGINSVASCAMAGRTQVGDWMPVWEPREVSFALGAEILEAWSRTVVKTTN